MFKVNRTLFGLYALVGATGVACSQTKPPALTPVVVTKPEQPSPVALPAATESVKKPKSPFAIVAKTQGNENFASLHRLTNGIAVVDVIDGAWLIRTVDTAGAVKVVTPALAFVDTQHFEWASAVAGSTEDMWVTIAREQGRSSVQAATIHVSGANAKRIGPFGLDGVGEWTGGRWIGLRMMGMSGTDVFYSNDPQRFDLLKGTKVEMPKIPADSRITEVAALPSGKIIALGKRVDPKHPESVDAAPWEVWTLEVGQKPRSLVVGGGKKVMSARLLRSMPSTHVLVTAELDDVADDEDRNAAYRVESDRLVGGPIPSATGHSVSSDGSLWIAPTVDSGPHVQRGRLSAEGKWTFENIGFPDTDQLKATAGTECASVADSAGQIVALSDNDVWASARCECDPPSGEACPSVIFHTGVQAQVAQFESATKVLEAYKAKKQVQARK